MQERSFCQTSIWHLMISMNHRKIHLNAKPETIHRRRIRMCRIERKNLYYKNYNIEGKNRIEIKRKKETIMYWMWFSPVHVIHFRITLKIFMDLIIFDLSFDFTFPWGFFFTSFFYFFLLLLLFLWMSWIRTQQSVVHMISVQCRSDCMWQNYIVET